MRHYSPNMVSTDVYLCTLHLIDAIRDGDLKRFSTLLEKADLKLMDFAAVNLAIHFEREEMLERMLDVFKKNELKIQSTQGFIWGIEQDKFHLSSLLLPYLDEDALEDGLKLAHKPEIIDAIEPYIPSVKLALATHWCQNNQLYSLKKFTEKMGLDVIQKTAIEAVKMNDLKMVEFFLNYFKETQQDLSKNNNNILTWAVSSSLETLQTIMPHCSKDLYYEAMRKSISFEKHEYSNILMEHADFSNEEALEIFRLSTFRVNPKLCTVLVDRYPDCENRLSEVLSTALRGNDRVLFDRGFALVNAEHPETLDHAMEAAWWASKCGRGEYLSILSEKIDLNRALESMYITTRLKFKEQDYDCLRDFLAQQQHDVISTSIGNVGGPARRKM